MKLDTVVNNITRIINHLRGFIETKYEAESGPAKAKSVSHHKYKYKYKYKHRQEIAPRGWCERLSSWRRHRRKAQRSVNADDHADPDYSSLGPALTAPGNGGSLISISVDPSAFGGSMMPNKTTIIITPAVCRRQAKCVSPYCTAWRRRQWYIMERKE